MKKPAWLILGVICLVAGLALGLTNAFTQDAIRRQSAADEDKARAAVMPQADAFEELAVPENTAVDGVSILSCYAAFSKGEACGWVVKASAQGYGGPIEVTLGVGLDGVVTGINCGGASFAETAGLGAKVKEGDFTHQFAGMSAPVRVTKDGGEVDAVTSATISSRAVCDAVNAACEYAGTLGE
ncbi:MAG TPA: RnfABCDGE type electron transport complex subunit G [Clostridia bacterium]|nr:RnfABCDGE type electron transport complex subunit G [Clostridia bacterium]